MAAEDEDPLGAETPGGDHAAQADGPVADDGHVLAGGDPRGTGGVVAGAHHVGEREQRRHQRVVLADREDDERPVRLGDAHGFSLAAVHARCRPTSRRAGTRSEDPRGRRRRCRPTRRTARRRGRPGLTVRTSHPTASTTPMDSWPIRRPCSVGSMDLYGQRSLPQMQARVTTRSASVGSWRLASGTFSTRTSPAPYMTVARIGEPFVQRRLPSLKHTGAWRGSPSGAGYRRCRRIDPTARTV